MSDIDNIKRLAADLNVNQDAQEALWQREGCPRGKAWAKLAEPLWDEQERIEAELAPLLLGWAQQQTEPLLVGYDVFGYLRIDYARIRKATGLKMHGSRIKGLLGWAMQERSKKLLTEKARSMSDDEWTEYEAGFCTTTQEGQNTLDYMKQARAEHAHG